MILKVHKITPYLQYCSSLPESKISGSFSTGNRFELQGILRQGHRMTPKDIGHYKVKDTPYMFHLSLCTTKKAVFDTKLVKIGKAPNDLRMILNT